MKLRDAFHAHRPEGFAPHYEVELLYPRAPRIVAEGLRAILGARCPEVALRTEEPPWRLVQGGERPGLRPEWTLAPAPPLGDRLAPALAQSWWWREAAAFAPHCDAALVLRDAGIAALDGRQRIELLYPQAPQLAPNALCSALAGRCPEVALRTEAPAPAEEAPWRLIIDDDRAGLRPEWTLRPAPPLGDRLAPALAQSWWWREAAAFAPQCEAALVLRDDGIAALDGRQRIELLSRVLAAVLELAPCTAVHWVPSQQVLEPRALQQAWAEDGFATPLPAAVNVRFYRLEESAAVLGGQPDQEYLMDTLGLAAVGLRDLQCHFRGLDPEEVGRTLHQTALHLWHQAWAPKNGDTVAGPRPGDVWRCAHELAIAAPRRDVIDLDPGFPFTGGLSDQG